MEDKPAMDKLDQVSIRLVKEPPLMSDRRMDSPAAAASVMAEFLQEMDRELFCVVNLRNDLKPINMNIVSVGALNYSLVHPRELMKSAVLSNAASIMLLHNHPSGRLTPSKEDIRITDRLNYVCEILGIPMTDHLIIGHDQQVYSFRERGQIKIPELTYEEDADHIKLGQSIAAEEKLNQEINPKEHETARPKKKREEVSL